MSDSDEAIEKPLKIAPEEHEEERKNASTKKQLSSSKLKALAKAREVRKENIQLLKELKAKEKEDFKKQKQELRERVKEIKTKKQPVKPKKTKIIYVSDTEDDSDDEMVEEIVYTKPKPRPKTTPAVRVPKQDKPEPSKPKYAITNNDIWG